MQPARQGWARVSFQEIRAAFDFVAMGGMDHQAFLSRATGTVHWHSEYGDFDPLPDDIDESEDYVALPDKRELGLGRRLVMAFAEEVMPRDADEIARIFDRKGAYRRFKDLLLRRDMLDRWHAFEDAAIDKALRAWCEDNEIEPIDEPAADQAERA